MDTDCLVRLDRKSKKLNDVAFVRAIAFLPTADARVKLKSLYPAL
jgi:hypothetical protein